MMVLLACRSGRGGDDERPRPGEGQATFLLGEVGVAWMSRDTTRTS